MTLLHGRADIRMRQQEDGGRVPNLYITFRAMLEKELKPAYSQEFARDRQASLKQEEVVVHCPCEKSGGHTFSQIEPYDNVAKQLILCVSLISKSRTTTLIGITLAVCTTTEGRA